MMQPVKVDSEITCLCFHPSKCLLGAGNIDGHVKIYSYEDENVREIMSFECQKKSTRALGFAPEGEQLISASADKSFSVINVETGRVEYRKKKSHEASIYSLVIAGRHVVATGDDDGCVKLWDIRQKKELMVMNESTETITDMVVDDHRKLLLATSAEGTLTAYDVRKHKLKVQSELIDSGLQSLAIVKNGEKVVCGGEDGVLHFFNWGEWGNISDRYPGHPMSIEKIVLLPNGLICTAASDAIRAVNLFPNRIVEIVGDHNGLPVEGLSLSHCGKWLASCSHDEHIRFWDVSELECQTVGKSKKLKQQKKKYVPKSEVEKRNKFFTDLVEDMKSKEVGEKSSDDKSREDKHSDNSADDKNNDDNEDSDDE